MVKLERVGQISEHKSGGMTSVPTNISNKTFKTNPEHVNEKFNANMNSLFQLKRQSSSVQIQKRSKQSDAKAEKMEKTNNPQTASTHSANRKEPAKIIKKKQVNFKEIQKNEFAKEPSLTSTPKTSKVTRERSSSPMDDTKEIVNDEQETDPLAGIDAAYFQTTPEFINCKANNKDDSQDHNKSQLSQLIQQIDLLRQEQKQSFKDVFAEIDKRFKEQDAKIETMESKTEELKTDVTNVQEEMIGVINYMNNEFADTVHFHDVIEYQNEIERNKNTLMITKVTDLEEAAAALDIVAPGQDGLRKAKIEEFCKGQKPRRVIWNRNTEETPPEETNDEDIGGTNDDDKREEKETKLTN